MAKKGPKTENKSSEKALDFSDFDEAKESEFVDSLIAEASEAVPNIDLEKPKWAQFPKESMEKVKKAGYILPELKFRKGASYSIILLETPKEVKTDKGTFFVAKVDDREMIKNCKCNASFRFSLDAEKEKLGLSYAELVGKRLIVQKNESGMVSVQIKL